jgi:Secretion system C-terminal sorting domain
MKKLTVLFLSICVIYSAMGQLRPRSMTMRKDHKVLSTKGLMDDEIIGIKPPRTTAFTKSALDDPSTMVTRYDYQTNHANQNRMYYYPDGTIGVTAIMAHNDNYTDRGTGYNYFNGTDWGPAPAARIETVRTGWPSYAPCGANGEIVVTHNGSNGLTISRRANKGSGTWTQTTLSGPGGTVPIAWPRVVTSGPDHNDIHIICGIGQAYQGLDFAIVYYRSLDGGETWETQGRLIDGMTQDEYKAFWSDCYTWADPKGDTLCFVVGFAWFDQFIMKSFDNGTTWTKTVIWPCPYNKWAGGDSTGTFWCPDGSSAIVLDKNGKAHVTFGLMRANGDENGNMYWFPQTDGLVYWNEDMPQLPFDINPDTLIAHNNYIGWVQDTMVFHANDSELAYYFWNSMSSFPTMVTDDQNELFVMWSGVTNFRDPNNFMLRHIYARASSDLGITWKDTITDLTSGLDYNFTECVYPTASPNSSADNFFLVFQGDPEAGNYIGSTMGLQGQQGTDDNDIVFLSPLKSQLIPVGNDEKKAVPDFYVSQNVPNPVQGTTSVQVKLEHPATLSLELYSTVGQKVMELHKGQVGSGAWQFVIDASGLNPGVYFYTIRAGSQQITKKMIVE